MIALDIPGIGQVRWLYLVLDVNGTISLDGELLPGVNERIARLSDVLDVRLLTADTRGRAATLAETLHVNWERVEPGQEAVQKQQYVQALDAASVIAMGNGNNDVAMLATAGLGIAVLGAEGTSVATWQAADVVAPSITDALDMLLDPTRLLATLRH